MSSADEADERVLFNGQQIDGHDAEDGHYHNEREESDDDEDNHEDNPQINDLNHPIDHPLRVHSMPNQINQLSLSQSSRRTRRDTINRCQGRVYSPIDDEFYIFTQENVASLSFPMFNELRSSGKLLDVDIVVDNTTIKAHKVVLAATIPYFQGMFTHDVIEATSSVINIAPGAPSILNNDPGDGGQATDDVHGAIGGQLRPQLEPDDENLDTIAGKSDDLSPLRMDGEAFSALIDFAYTGSIKITVSNVQAILVAASYLGLQSVCDACSDYLQERLSSNNVLGIKSFAESLSCPNLVNAASKYIEQHFEQVSKSEEFMSLTCKEVSDIVSRDELNVRGEEVVFDAVINWIKCGHHGQPSDHREKYLPTLLTLVRLPLLSPQFLADHVATEALIRQNHGCRDLLDEAKDYHLMPERRLLLQSFRTRHRSNCDNVGIIYAVGGLTKTGDSLSTVETYDVKGDRWYPAEAMTMLRSRVGVAVMGSKLYAIGGYNGTERLSTVEVFDPILKSWSRVASMNCKRSAVGAATLGNRLFVCGGYDGVSSLNTVECYNADKNEWIMIQCMSKHRSAAGVVSFQGHLIALGGHDGLSIFDSVEKYDPIHGVWSPLPSMKTRRCRLGVASLGGKLYVCGGYDGSTFLQTAEVYDPESKSWRFIAPMNVMRSRVALVANCGKLFAIGGYDGVSNLSTVEVYDPSADKWTFVCPMGAHEGGVGVGVIPNF